MTNSEALILGAVQGFTEFLPVSSSGHLVLAQHLLSLKEDMLVFDIFVHFGTLLSVLFVFRKMLIKLMTGLLNDTKKLVSGNNSLSSIYKTSPELKMIVALALGTIPAGVAGILLNDRAEALFSSPFPVLIALFVTGCILIGTFFKSCGKENIGIGRGLIIGITQMIAIIPGISRSGSTIAAAIYSGAEREKAGEFSFLLSIPVIAGATILALDDFLSGANSISTLTASLGVLSSFITGVFSLTLLMKLIKRGKLGYFGYYCIAVSILGLIFIK